MDLSVIILNLNTRDLLRDCLKSLAQSELGGPNPVYSFEVVISDNGSTDGSLEMVGDEFSQFKLIDNKRNLGFAAGNNAALPWVTGRYVLFLNSDTRVPQGTLTEMISFMDGNQKIGAATCLIELFDGQMDFNCHRGFPTPWSALTHFSGLEKIFPKSKLFAGYFQTYKDLKSVHEIDALEGAFILVRREAAESVSLVPNKWWDEDYFFYAEDIDFCYRLKERGWKIMYNPKVKVSHYKGATHGMKNKGVASLTSEDKIKIVASTTQAMRTFYEKHYRRKYPALVTWIVLFGVEILGKRRVSKI